MITRLEFTEREQIETLIKQSYSGQEIAKILNRSPYCIHSEIRNNGGRKSYNAQDAQKRSELMNREKYRAILKRRELSDGELAELKIDIESGMTLSEASLIHSISRSTIRRLIKDGLIKFKRKDYVGIEERLCSLEEQVKIWSEQIKQTR